MKKMSVKLFHIKVNDIFEELSEENKRLLNELMFANKCLNALNKLKAFIDSVFDKLNTNLDSNERIKYEDINKEIEESLKHKTNDINVIISKSLKPVSNENIKQKTKININKEFVCDYKDCDKSYSNKFFLSQHIKSFHNKKDLNKYKINKNNNQFKRELIDKEIDFNKIQDLKPSKQTNTRKVVKRRKPVINKLSKKSNKTQKPKINPNIIIESKANTSKQFVCDFNGCGKQYSRKDILMVHKESIHDNKSAVCEVCNKVFKNIRRMKVHRRVYHFKAKKYSCDYPNCDYKSSIRNNVFYHKIKHTNERPFACNIEGCGKAFKMGYTLNQHLKLHFITEKKFKCLFEGCNELFRTSHGLRAHSVNNHSGIKYRCDWPGCEFETKFPSSVKVHNLVHSSESNFVCDWPQCGKTFKRKNALKHHLRVHRSDKRYACHWPGCQYRCVFSGNLTKHMRVHQK